MADSLVARLAASCNPFLLTEFIGIIESGRLDALADNDHVAIASPGSRPIKAHEIDGRAYVTGLGPIMRIDEIPDLPSDIRDGLKDKRHLSETPSESCRTHINAVDTAAAAPPSEGEYGPVFDADEIAAARALLARLQRKRAIYVGPMGRPIAGSMVTVDLCVKLARLRLVRAIEIDDWLMVRPPRSEPAAVEHL